MAASPQLQFLAWVAASCGQSTRTVLLLGVSIVLAVAPCTVPKQGVLHRFGSLPQGACCWVAVSFWLRRPVQLVERVPASCWQATQFLGCRVAVPSWLRHPLQWCLCRCLHITWIPLLPYSLRLLVCPEAGAYTLAQPVGFSGCDSLLLLVCPEAGAYTLARHGGLCWLLLGLTHNVCTWYSQDKRVERCLTGVVTCY